jgi:hypothetical protein
VGSLNDLLYKLKSLKHSSQKCAIKGALARNFLRLGCSPSLASGLGTGSPIFSAEKIGSAVRFLYI